jgi:transcription antitermination protein NusB
MARAEHLVGKRRMAREMAVQMLYQLDLGGSSLADVLATFDVDDYLDSRRDEESGDTPLASRPEAELALAQAREMTAATVACRDELDACIRGQAEHWRLERMPAVDRNILRLAAWELLHAPDVPPLVIVDEAVELAKRFGSEHSGRFVNGLLDGLMRARVAAGEARR